MYLFIYLFIYLFKKKNPLVTWHYLIGNMCHATNPFLGVRSHSWPAPPSFFFPPPSSSFPALDLSHDQVPFFSKIFLFSSSGQRPASPLASFISPAHNSISNDIWLGILTHSYLFYTNIFEMFFQKFVNSNVC
jgi:hypothetical protein